MGRKTDQGGFEIYHHASFVITKTRINLLGRDFVEGFSKFEEEIEVFIKDQVLQHTAFHCIAIAIVIAMHAFVLRWWGLGNVKIRKVGNWGLAEIGPGRNWARKKLGPGRNGPGRNCDLARNGYGWKWAPRVKEWNELLQILLNSVHTLKVKLKIWWKEMIWWWIDDADDMGLNFNGGSAFESLPTPVHMQSRSPTI